MIECVNPSEYELVIKKSRFIAVSRQIDGREDVKDVIDGLKRIHPEARHICYGFIADEKGDDFGYDDDGEPSGTAGKPIYSALAAAGVRKSLIAVVRYFGGIKLGAGGLTRAYRQSAAELIENAGTSKADKYAVYDIECGNDEYKKASAYFRSASCIVEQILYNKTVKCVVLAPIGCDLAGALKSLGITPVKTGERYIFEERR